jgi:hypothetical protein
MDRLHDRVPDEYFDDSPSVGRRFPPEGKPSPVTSGCIEDTVVQCGCIEDIVVEFCGTCGIELCCSVVSNI